MRLDSLLGLLGFLVAGIAFYIAAIGMILDEWARDNRESALFGAAMLLAATLLIAAVILHGGF